MALCWVGGWGGGGGVEIGTKILQFKMDDNTELISQIFTSDFMAQRLPSVSLPPSLKPKSFGGNRTNSFLKI